MKYRSAYGLRMKIGLRATNSSQFEHLVTVIFALQTRGVALTHARYTHTDRKTENGVNFRIFWNYVSIQCRVSQKNGRC